MGGIPAAGQHIAKPRRALGWDAAPVQHFSVAIDHSDGELELMGGCRHCDRARGRAQIVDNVEQAIGATHPLRASSRASRHLRQGVFLSFLSAAHTFAEG